MLRETVVLCNEIGVGKENENVIVYNYLIPIWAMATFYENNYKKSITYDQAIASSSYYKVYTENGIIKKKELYENGILEFYEYYKLPGELDIDIINTFNYTALTFVIIDSYEISNFKAQITRVYKGDSYLTKQRFLYDSDGYMLCEENFDLLSDQPISEETKKFLFRDSYDDYFPIMTAHYNIDGTLNFIEYDTLSDQDEIWFYEDGIPGETDIPTLALYLGVSMAEMQYYLTSQLEP